VRQNSGNLILAASLDLLAGRGSWKSERNCWMERPEEMGASRRGKLRVVATKFADGHRHV